MDGRTGLALGNEAERNFLTGMRHLRYKLTGPGSVPQGKTIRPATAREQARGIDFVITCLFFQSFEVIPLQLTISGNILSRTRLRWKLKLALNREIALLWPAQDYSGRGFCSFLRSAAAGHGRTLRKLERRFAIASEVYLGLREPPWLHHYHENMAQHKRILHKTVGAL